jgi:hypothetical protein
MPTAVSTGDVDAVAPTEGIGIAIRSIVDDRGLKVPPTGVDRVAELSQQRNFSATVRDY